MKKHALYKSNISGVFNNYKIKSIKTKLLQICFHSRVPCQIRNYLQTISYNKSIVND